MPKVYSVIEVRPRTWGTMVAGLSFFITTSMVLGILWPMERAKRREAEEARERLTIHAHRLAQAKQELQGALVEERERKQAILSELNEAKIQISSLREQFGLASSRINALQGELSQEEELRSYLEAAIKTQQQKAEVAKARNSEAVELGKIVVGKNGSRSRVLRAFPEMGFVILSLGKEIALEQGQLVDIIRDNQVIAKAKIEKVSTQICSAQLLPEWRQVAIQESDEVNLTKK